METIKDVISPYREKIKELKKSKKCDDCQEFEHLKLRLRIADITIWSVIIFDLIMIFVLMIKK